MSGSPAVRMGLAGVTAAFATACAAHAAGSRAAGVHLDWSLLKVPDFAAEYQRGYEFGRRMAAERARSPGLGAAGRAEVDRDERNRKADLARGDGADRARRAKGLVAAGHCDDARNFALGLGDVDLATRVTNLCRRDAAPW